MRAKFDLKDITGMLIIAVCLFFVIVFLNSCASSKVQKSSKESKTDSTTEVKTEVKKESEINTIDKTVTTTIQEEEKLTKEPGVSTEITGETEATLDSAGFFVRTTVNTVTGKFKTTIRTPAKETTTKTKTITHEAKNLSKNEVVTSDSSNNVETKVKTANKDTTVDRQTEGMWEVTLGYVFDYWWIWLIILVLLGVGYWTYRKFIKK